MTQRELIGKYRNPNDSYLVFIDDYVSRETTSNLRNYYQKAIIELPNWKHMAVYFRYGISKSGIIFPLHMVVREAESEDGQKLLEVIRPAIELRSAIITGYSSTYEPYGANPSVIDVEGHPRANDEAKRAWLMIVKKKIHH